MKSKLHVLVCMAALSGLPLMAGEGDTTPVSVEQRFRETDLSLALRQYERVKMEVFECRLKLDLLETDDEMTETARKKRRELLARRKDILEQRADQLRLDAHRLGEQIAVAKTK